jgi:hypothetical protein
MLIAINVKGSTDMMPVTDQTAQIAHLEKEHRNLLARLERLEKKRGWFAAFLANVLLLVMAGLLADYLGFFPPNVDHLPLRAKSIEAEEFTLREPSGKVRARLVPEGNNGFRLVDRNGKVLLAGPSSP